MQTIDQHTPGVPGADEGSDGFGYAVSLGDIYGDGRADAVVSADYESIGADTRTGSVTVFRGTPTGLSASDAEVFHQDTAGVPGANEDHDESVPPYGSPTSTETATPTCPSVVVGRTRTTVGCGASGAPHQV